ncbi:hypothetical protein F2P79_023498, partial [Pimephales promelas]
TIEGQIEGATGGVYFSCGWTCGRTGECVEVSLPLLQIQRRCVPDTLPGVCGYLWASSVPATHSNGTAHTAL